VCKASQTILLRRRWFATELRIDCSGPGGEAALLSPSWELRPDGDGTLLAFSSTLELPAGYRTMVLAGWHWHLDALAGFLGGTPADLVNVTGWDQIHQRYAWPRARTRPFS
jgi:hypothetical protein